MLDYSTIYKVIITKDVKELSNEYLFESKYSWEFRTKASPVPENIASTITTTPLNESVGVALDTVISTSFDESIDANTLNLKNFKIKVADSEVGIIGQVTYNSTFFTVIFTPMENLENNTKYTATIKQGVKNLNGNPIESEYSWAFTTITKLDPIDLAPKIIIKTPRDNSTGVLVNTNISILFDTAMDTRQRGHSLKEHKKPINYE